MKGFFRSLDDIDEIIKDGSSFQNARALIALMTNSASTIYALNLLDAGWLEPLESLGYFRGDSSNASSFAAESIVFWPVSAYLKRIAKKAQGDHRIGQTLSRILSFMPTPRNYAIVRDMIEISVALPREMRRGIVPVVQRVLSRADNIEFANVSALITSLAEEGDVSPALRLFSTVFAIFRVDAETPGPNLSAAARTFMDNWNYRQEMKKCLPSLTRTGGLRFLEHLCQVLDEHVRLDAKGGFQGPDDFSYIWRPAIEEHSQNIHDDPRDTVITAIRECAASLALQMPSQFPEIIEMMDSRQWFIFTRIMLYLLAESPVASAGEIAKYSTQPYLFSEVGVRHEYALLLRNRFSILSGDQQGAILRMIENGPDLTGVMAHVQRAFNRSLTEVEAVAHVRRWQYDWLSFIEAHLPREWEDRFEVLKREFGEPVHPDFPHYTSSGFSLGGMGALVSGLDEGIGVETLLERFGGHNGAVVFSEEELRDTARALRNLNQKDRYTIAARAREVVLLPVLLLDAMASALLSPVDGLKEKIPMILSLVAGIVDRAAVVGSESEREALLEVATRVVYQLLPDGGGQITGEQLPILRRIMTQLLTFVRPDISEHRRKVYGNVDPLTEAINGLDGRIVDAGVKVASLERNLTSGNNSRNQAPTWLFSNLSSILPRLAPHELRVSAILGYRFPWLTQLSHSWSVEHARSIFPMQPSQSPRWAVAWSSYVMYSGAYDDVFEILGSQYEKAVGDMSEKKLTSRSNPDLGLAQHLAAYYWRGRLTLKDKLFQEFMRLGSEDTISMFLLTIGRGVGEGAEIPSEALQQLADWTVSKWRSRRRTAKKALSAFGWWFPHGPLGDSRWRIELLRKAVMKSGTVQNLDQVLKTLEELALDMPDQVIGCLRALALGSTNESTTYHLSSKSETILEKAVQGASISTLKRIREIADHFGSHGYFQYRRFAVVA